MTDRHDETAALLVLLRERTSSWGRIASQVALAGSALSVLKGADDGVLFDLPVDEARIESARKDILSWESRRLRVVTVLDPQYPRRLLDIPEPPPFLFYAGDLHREEAGLSLVGSRNAPPMALRLAGDIARFLVDQGMAVVSGLAAGVDAAAHRAALDAGGRTVAFIGTGITRAYPAAHADLQQEIAERGLVLSQFSPDAPPTKQAFPLRNALISGYGLATIVVEAGEYSGSRIPARLAHESGRPVILTEQVASTTTWGSALRGRPGVFVVNSMDELAGVVREI